MTNKKKQSTEAAVREIRRRTRRKFAPEEKVRIVLEGLPGGAEHFGALPPRRHRGQPSTTAGARTFWKSARNSWLETPFGKPPAQRSRRGSQST
jgi:hypothetical protein